MKKAIVLLALLCAFAFVLPSCSNSSPGKTEKAASEKVKYACPMKCEGDKTYDMEGQCPVCGMDLEKLEPVQ